MIKKNYTNTNVIQIVKFKTGTATHKSNGKKYSQTCLKGHLYTKKCITDHSL